MRRGQACREDLRTTHCEIPACVAVCHRGLIGDQVLDAGFRVHHPSQACSLGSWWQGRPRPRCPRSLRGHQAVARLAVTFGLGAIRGEHLGSAHRDVAAVGALVCCSGGWCQEVLDAGGQVNPRDKPGPPQGKPHPAPRPCVSTHDQRRQRWRNLPTAGNSARSAAHRVRRGACGGCCRRSSGPARAPCRARAASEMSWIRRSR